MDAGMQTFAQKQCDGTRFATSFAGRIRMTGEASIQEIHSPSFKAAELRSESSRVAALLAAFAALLVILLIRGAFSLAGGGRGEAWPFALLLAGMTAYELARLGYIRKAITLGRTASQARWAANVFIESLFPTAVLLLEVQTPSFGPERTLTSPVVLIYLLFTILSTLHLDPALSRLSGIFSAAGYAAVAVYIFVKFPETAAAAPLVVYGISISYIALLLLGGFAAGAVALQIRRHVLAALRDAENRAKIAEFEHDLGMARSIQQGLFPTSAPHIPGFEVAGWNQPADETGGDYYDWQQLEDGRVAVTVADVTGHGIGSALMMSACRAYARAGLATEPDVQKLLNHLNPLLHYDLPEEKFVTLAAALLDPQYAAGQLISAGHGPLLFYAAAEDSFYSFEAQGPPLGLLPRIPYGGPEKLKFERGDILLLVTDGFIEFADASDEQFGAGRVQEVIRANRDKSPAEMISELHSAVVRFAAGAPQLDDLTALVVKKV
jgi:serine phosphatase RsbU (regulator of sigma subunit)